MAKKRRAAKKSFHPKQHHEETKPTNELIIQEGSSSSVTVAEEKPSSSKKFSLKSLVAIKKFRLFDARFPKKDARHYWPIGTLIVVLLLIGFYTFILHDLPSPTKLSSPGDIPLSTKLYDRNGKLLYNIYTSQNRTSISLKEIPTTVKEATIAIEDKDFYHHSFFDVRGIIRAAIQTVFKQNLQGGSTITQQLVKTALLTQERTVQRKIKELFLASITEAIYSKDQILEMYLNQIPYGGTTYGVEAAAETFFNKKAKDLDLAESALIAGLPNAPTLYSPFGPNPQLSKERQKEVLRRMVEDKYITQDQSDQAANEELHFANNISDIKAPHFVLYVKDLLEKKYGKKLVEEGGLQVTTTLDLDLQDYAQATVSSEIAKLTRLQVSNGAALVTDPGTGEILAMVGSKDYFDETIGGNNNLTVLPRQPGSSIKPINFAAGFGKGIVSPATVLADKATCFGSNGNAKGYCPGNYDGKFHGPTQIRYALGNSYNIPAVKMLELNGVEDMIATASAMGITTFTQADRYGLSLTLGAGEVPMVDMATAFGVFANSGYRVDLVSILKVVDPKGKVLEEYKAPANPFFAKKAIPEGVAYLISSILSDNGARSAAFGGASELVIPKRTVSVKTGTTDSKRDNWTIGYTPSRLVAVWVGNNDNTPMNPALTSGITGAAPIWHKVMQHVLENLPDETLKKPDTVVMTPICTDTGLLANAKEGVSAPCPIRNEYFLKGFVKDFHKVEKENILVDKGTQRPPPDGQTDNVEYKEETVLIDPTGDKLCLSCPPEITPTPTP